MVEAGETIVTEIVLFPLQQKGEEVEEPVQSKEDKNLDVVLENLDVQKTVLKKLEGTKLIFDKIEC